MAKAIVLKGKAVAEITSTLTGAEFSVELQDSGVPVQATYSINLTSSGTKPMVGITSYGRITGVFGSSDLSTGLTVTAVPLGDDGTHATTAATTLTALLAADIGDSIVASP